MAKGQGVGRWRRRVWGTTLVGILLLSLFFGILAGIGALWHINQHIGTYPQGSRVLFMANQQYMTTQLSVRDIGLQAGEYTIDSRLLTFTAYVAPDIGNGATRWLYVGVWLPTWLIGIAAMGSIVVTFTMLRRSYRGDRVGHCPTCGYDLRATPDRCPECGSVAQASGT